MTQHEPSVSNAKRHTRASEGFTVRVRRLAEPRLELSRLGGIEPELVSAAVLRPSVRGGNFDQFPTHHPVSTV